MLPKHLTSTYQQYKADTDSIASWLASTARRFGYTPSADGSAPSKSQKKRDKARKAAKAAQTDDAATGVPTHVHGRPTYTIPIRDFSSLAEYIAALEAPPIGVPLIFSEALNRAISVRQSFSKALIEYIPQNAKTNASHDRHAYFVDVLEHVKKILGPRIRKEPPTPLEQTLLDEVRNRFGNLQVHEPSETFANAPDVDRTPVVPTDPAEEEANYKAEQIQGLEEDFLAFHLLLSDLSKLRTEASRTWAAYKSGLIELATAAITTNTAVDLARALEEDLQSTWSRHGGTEKMLPMFYAAQCMMQGTSINHRGRLGDEMNFKMYTVADVCFWPAYALLDSFKDIVDPREHLEYKPGFFGKYDANSNRGKKSDREKFKEDKIILMEALPEFLVLCRGTPGGMQMEDEFTRGLRIMFKTKQLPLWLAFAATIFLDCQHMLREKVERGFSDLWTAANQIKTTITNTNKERGDLSHENWPASNDAVVSELVGMIDAWVFEDPFIATKKLNKRPVLVEKYWLMRNHPWGCGIWKYYFQVHFQDLGIAYVNAWGSVMYSAHLYNAVRNEKLLGPGLVWKDMDLVFAMQGMKPFFTGTPPSNPEDYLKRFLLAMGASAASLSKGQKRKGKKASGLSLSKRGPMSLSTLAPVFSTFKERFSEENPRLGITTQDVEHILAQSQWTEEDDEFGEKDSESKEVFNLSMAKDEDIRGPQKDISKLKLSPARLLMTLRNSLQAEAMELSFDYLMLHRVCWRLLRSVKDACRTHLIDMFGPEYLERETQLPFVVGYIFMAATKTDQLADLLKLRQKRSDEVTSRLLVLAAKELNTMLEQQGGQWVSKLVLEGQYGLVADFEEDDSD